MELADEAAFVTGTGRGVGRALAARLAAEGCDVIGCDPTTEGQAQARAEVEAAGRRYAALAADPSDAEAARRVAGEAIGAGPIDRLVNDAGIVTSGRYRGAEFETWHETVRIDLVAVMAITHELLDHLRSRPEAQKGLPDG